MTRPPLGLIIKSLSETSTQRAGFSFSLLLLSVEESDRVYNQSQERNDEHCKFVLTHVLRVLPIFLVPRGGLPTLWRSTIYHINFIQVFGFFLGKNSKIPCKNRKHSAITLYFCCLYLCFAIFFTNFQKFCAKVLNNLLYLPRNSRIMPFF